MHVDDGLCAGDKYFEETLALLEKKFPFGSKKAFKFTFTGIDVQQNDDSSITLSLSRKEQNKSHQRINQQKNLLALKTLSPWKRNTH